MIANAIWITSVLKIQSTSTRAHKDTASLKWKCRNRQSQGALTWLGLYPWSGRWGLWPAWPAMPGWSQSALGRAGHDRSRGGRGGARPQQGRARPECPCAAGTGSGPGGARPEPEPAQTRPEPARARPGCSLRGWGGAGALRDGSDGVGSALERKTKTEIKADSEKGKILQKKKNGFICFSGLAGNVRIFYVGFAAKPSNIRKI
jgi:hypothetical protein